MNSNDATERMKQELAHGFLAVNQSKLQGGFWDEEAGAYLRARLGVNGTHGIELPDLRYTPFGLAGILRAHRLTGEGDYEHLSRAADWVYQQIMVNPHTEDVFYGGIWALAEAAIAFDEERYAQLLVQIVAGAGEWFESNPNLDLGVSLLGASELVERGVVDKTFSNLIMRKADVLSSSVNARGLPATGDRRAGYHQRMMYTVWGLCGAAAAFHNEDYEAAAKRILQFVTDNRIDADGGIRWHALYESNVKSDGSGAFYPYGSHIYYECHQCFYSIAVSLFSSLSGDKVFMQSNDKVLSWIFGDNRWGMDLTDPGVSGLPIRCVSMSGKTSLWNNRFKGVYEVGAYLAALALKVSK